MLYRDRKFKWAVISNLQNLLTFSETADEKKKSADDVNESSKNLVNDNKDAVDQLAVDDAEARRLMAQGKGLKDESNELYKKAKNASDLANKAEEDGKRVAREAKEMLETLLVRFLRATQGVEYSWFTPPFRMSFHDNFTFLKLLVYIMEA